MSMGLVGRKCGMTRRLTENGEAIPVTVIEVAPNRIVQIKTKQGDGYHALQVTTGIRHPSRVNKAMAGHYAKAQVEPGEALWEFRLSDDEYSQFDQLTAGKEIGVEIFREGQYVDVTGITQGKGFAGVVKRHHFKTQDATHGNSLAHRAPGSIGQNQTPGRVFKGKKMAGQMGNCKQTIQNLRIVAIDEKRHVILVRGGVPGPRGNYVLLHLAVKKDQALEGVRDGA